MSIIAQCFALKGEREVHQGEHSRFCSRYLGGVAQAYGRFDESVSDLDNEKNLHLVRNAKTWVIGVHDAQSHRRWRVFAQIY